MLVEKKSPVNSGDASDTVWSLGWKDPLEEEMATHSSILAWRISWTEKPGGLQSIWSQRVRHDWGTNQHNNMYVSFLWKARSYPPFPQMRKWRLSVKLLGSHSWLLTGAGLCVYDPKSRCASPFPSTQLTFSFFTLDYQKSLESSSDFLAGIQHH